MSVTHEAIIRQTLSESMPKLRYELTGPLSEAINGVPVFHVVVRFTVPVPCFDESSEEVEYRARDAARSLGELMFESSQHVCSPAFMLSASRQLSAFVDTCVKQGDNVFSTVAENCGH